jgi:DNA-binding NarL/FixJ family response regulator
MGKSKIVPKDIPRRGWLKYGFQARAHSGVTGSPTLRRPTEKGTGMGELPRLPYEILLVEDHPLVRQGIKAIVAEEAELTLVGELQDGWELLDRLNHRIPQMVILDISLPYLGGIEATRLIKSSHPEIKVLILTLHNRREYVDQARLAGAEGYLLKDEVGKELLPAIAALRQGGTYLSPLLTG